MFLDIQEQSVPNGLELQLAPAKKLQLGWLGSAQRQSQNTSLAWLGLYQVLNVQAELGYGSEKIETYELSLARAWEK